MNREVTTIPTQDYAHRSTLRDTRTNISTNTTLVRFVCNCGYATIYQTSAEEAAADMTVHHDLVNKHGIARHQHPFTD